MYCVENELTPLEKLKIVESERRMRRGEITENDFERLKDVIESDSMVRFHRMHGSSKIRNKKSLKHKARMAKLSKKNNRKR